VNCDDSRTFIDVDGGRAVQIPPKCLRASKSRLEDVSLKVAWPQTLYPQ
jgi:hypothetical protein